MAGTAPAGVTSGIAVAFHYGGDVTNAGGGVIDGKYSGVLLFAAGTVTNEAGAEISGTVNIGVYIGYGDGTVINAGTISGSTYAIQFGGSYNDRVVLDPGSVLLGTVAGGSGSNVLELATGSGVGTISGLGTSFTNFGTIQVDTAAAWDMTGANTIASGGMLVDRGTLTAGSGALLVNDGTIKVNGGVLIDDKPLHGTGTIDITNGGAVNLLSTASQTTIDFEDGGKLELANPSGVSISDFVVGDTIDLTDLSFSTADKVTYNSSLHEIVVYHDGHQTLATVDVTGVTGTPTLQRDGNGTDIVVCYLRGTRILTEDGEIAVEDLRPGMRVVTLSGRGPALKPVTWIGRRRLDAARHRRSDEVYPVRITAGALGENTPHRDLLVSPGHAVFVEGVLIPAQRLINGETIIQDRTVSAIEYFHVELEQHDLLLAEGLAAESYYDSGNRRFFDGTGEPVDLHAGPDDERVQAASRFRMSNAGNGVSEERRRRVERTAGRNQKSAGRSSHAQAV